MEAVTDADVAKAIEQSLAQKGIVIQADAEKFALAIPEWMGVGKITSQLKEARELAAAIGKSKGSAKGLAPVSAPPGRPSSNEEETFMPGTIDFPNTDANQVLTIYSELTDRTLIRTFPLPAPTIALRTYTSLTVEESIYAFTAVFALNGISVASAGEKCLFAVP